MARKIRWTPTNECNPRNTLFLLVHRRTRVYTISTLVLKKKKKLQLKKRYYKSGELSSGWERDLSRNYRVFLKHHTRLVILPQECKYNTFFCFLFSPLPSVVIVNLNRSSASPLGNFVKSNEINAVPGLRKPRSFRKENS